jgi:hypothetical protein
MSYYGPQQPRPHPRPCPISQKWNKGLTKEVRKVQHKLGIAVEDRAPLPDDKKKQERFAR